MRMVAMVLVSDQLPGCVCQVLDTPAPGAPASSEQPSQSSTAGPGALEGGVAGSTTGFVVIAAAAAARQQQAAEDERRRQQQQQQQQWQFNK